MRRSFASISVLAVVAAAMAIFVSSAGAGSNSRSAAIATFTDSTGEVAGAPDISTVTASLEGDVLKVEAQVTDVPLMSQGALMFMQIGRAHV